MRYKIYHLTGQIAPVMRKAEPVLCGLRWLGLYREIALPPLPQTARQGWGTHFSGWLKNRRSFAPLRMTSIKLRCARRSDWISVDWLREAVAGRLVLLVGVGVLDGVAIRDLEEGWVGFAALEIGRFAGRGAGARIIVDLEQDDVQLR